MYKGWGGENESEHWRGGGGYLTRWRRSTATLDHTRRLICCKLSAVSAWLPINQRLQCDDALTPDSDSYSSLVHPWNGDSFLPQSRFHRNSEHANWSMFFAVFSSLHVFSFSKAFLKFKPRRIRKLWILHKKKSGLIGKLGGKSL